MAKNSQQRKKGTHPVGFHTIDYGSEYRGALYPGSFASTAVHSTRAWGEDSNAPQSIVLGAGTGSALTPPPPHMSDSTFEGQQGSPKNQTHRSFILPGEKPDKNQRYLHKSGAHSKSQHYKQKFVPGGAIGPPANQAFTPSIGNLMKKSRTPRELLSRDQMQPP